MELEPRISAPAHATGAVEGVPLDQLAPDETFKLRPEGDVSTLASEIGRLGQLVPVEIRPLPGAAEGTARWQLVSGFRRVAALRLLQRDRMLARVHQQLSDEDAWGIALSQALLTEPLLQGDLEALRTKILDSGQASWAYDLVDEALVRAPVDPELREKLHAMLRAPEQDEREEEAPPEAPENAGEEPSGEQTAGEEAPVEMTPEEFAADLTARLYELNGDLAAAFDAWKDLPGAGRWRLLEQIRYIAELLPLLEGKG